MAQESCRHKTSQFFATVHALGVLIAAIQTVNEHEYSLLISSLNQAVGILDRNRTPDPAFIAAYDTLKQSRAMILKALGRSQAAPSGPNIVAAAA